SPLTDARAGWPVSLIVAVMMFTSGQLYLEWAIRRDLKRGERFVPRAGDPSWSPESRPAGLPPLWRALLPLIVTLLALNVLPHLPPALGRGLATWLGLDSSSESDAWSGRLGAFCRMLVGFPGDPTLAIFLGVL